jgi:hypothetical protein
MWMAEAVTIEGQTPEPYLTHEEVQRGIAATLAKDRAMEEIHRLKHELESMITWISTQLSSVETAINYCEG